MKVLHIDNIREDSGRDLLELQLDRLIFRQPADAGLVAILPCYDQAGTLTALDVCTATPDEPKSMIDARFVSAANLLMDVAADRRRLAHERGDRPMHVGVDWAAGDRGVIITAPPAFTSERVSEESSPMKNHDHHKDREDHKHKSLAAMAKESSADGRARAFVAQQVAFMRARAGQIIAGLKDGSLSIEEAAAVIEGDIAHEEQAGHDIGLAIAHGVPA